MRPASPDESGFLPSGVGAWFHHQRLKCGAGLGQRLLVLPGALLGVEFMRDCRSAQFPYRGLIWRHSRSRNLHQR